MTHAAHQPPASIVPAALLLALAITVMPPQATAQDPAPVPGEPDSAYPDPGAPPHDRPPRPTQFPQVVEKNDSPAPAHRRHGHVPRRQHGIDPRIRTLTYSPGRVYDITTNYYVATIINFAEDETLLPRPIVGGDPRAWDIQIIAHNKISLKPIAESPSTNMTLFTDRREYYFHIDVANEHSTDQLALYAVYFDYPLEDQARQALRHPQYQAPGHTTTPYRPHSQPAAPHPSQSIIARQNELLRQSVALSNIYTGYRIKGSRNAKPETVFDDGRFTYFRFPPNMTVPAIYARDPEGEKLVNHHSRHNFMIVQRLADAFILRVGRSKTTVTRTRPIIDTPVAPARPGDPVRHQTAPPPAAPAAPPAPPRARAIVPRIGMTHDAIRHTDTLLTTPAIQALPPTPFDEITPILDSVPTAPEPALPWPTPPTAPASNSPALQDAYIRFTGAAPDIPCEGGEWQPQPDPEQPSRQQFVLHCP